MKFSTTILPLLCATLASSIFLEPREQPQQEVIMKPMSSDAALKVPGDNPLSYCANPSTYQVEVDWVDLDPNPPKKGATLTISGSGNFTEDIVDGATVEVKVSWGLIQLLHKTEDVCSNIGLIDLACPLNEGHLEFSKSVDLPSFVPPGTYEAKANIVDVDGKVVVCMEASVTFGF